MRSRHVQALKSFLITYRHDGSEWALELKARDAADARARLGKLAYATVDGELVAKVPAILGPFAMAATVLRNRFVGLFGGA